MSNKSTLAIALAALAAGAALGVLLAPESGAETRKKLMRKGDDLKDRLASMLEEGEELIAELKGKAQDAMHSTSDAIGNAANTARETSQAVRGKLKNATERGEI
ncbi:MAG: YtxH domain-containing protein [Flavobacteriales bacterium]|nr:MAG: YtxH domain-containing protein [Flavobacteriales bacterium]